MGAFAEGTAPRFGKARTVLETIVALLALRCVNDQTLAPGLGALGEVWQMRQNLLFSDAQLL